MTFWSGETIIRNAEASAKNASASAPALISPFDPTQIDCASYTLLMGSEVYITPPQDGLKPPYGEKLVLSQGKSFLIPPGQFAFLLTKERLSVPKDVVAFISLKSAKKYSGLVNVSGFHVDPGFQGYLIFAVYNAGPTRVCLAEGDKLFLIWFANVDNAQTIHNRIDYKKAPQTGITSDLIQGIPGQPVTLQSVADDLKSLRTEEINWIKSQITIIKSVAAGLAVGVAILLAVLAVDWYKYFHNGNATAPTVSIDIKTDPVPIVSLRSK